MYKPSILEIISLAKSNGLTVPEPPAAEIPAVKAAAPFTIASASNKALPVLTAVSLQGAAVELSAAQSKAPLNCSLVLEPIDPGKDKAFKVIPDA